MKRNIIIVITINNLLHSYHLMTRSENAPKIDYFDPNSPNSHAQFLEDAKHLTDIELAVKYKCSFGTVRLALSRPLGYKPAPRGRPFKKDKSGDGQ